MRHPAVSQLLRVLKNARLVRDCRGGSRRLYSVDPRGLEALRRYLERYWDGVLAAFADEAGRHARYAEGWLPTLARFAEAAERGAA